MEALDWEHNYDYSQLQKELSEFPEIEYNQLADEFSRSFMDLLKSYKEWIAEFGEWVEPAPNRLCNNETLFNVIAHIIGLGKKEYYKNLNHPRLIYDRILDQDFAESFLYVWHK